MESKDLLGGCVIKPEELEDSIIVVMIRQEIVD